MAKSETTQGSDLGQRTRRLRKSRGLTLAELGGQSGVSRAALSKIERGEMSPTYETLRKLANGLQVPLTTLVMEGDTSPKTGLRILRAGEGARHRNPLYKYELLSGSPELPGRTIYISEMAAEKVEDFPELHAHESQDFLYVLAGRIAAQFEQEKLFQLETGDSLTFDGRVPHAFANAGGSGEAARVLWVSDPI